jgi:hypothetical protein
MQPHLTASRADRTVAHWRIYRGGASWVWEPDPYPSALWRDVDFITFIIVVLRLEFSTVPSNLRRPADCICSHMCESGKRAGAGIHPAPRTYDGAGQFPSPCWHGTGGRRRDGGRGWTERWRLGRLRRRRQVGRQHDRVGQHHRCPRVHPGLAEAGLAGCRSRLSAVRET